MTGASHRTQPEIDAVEIALLRMFRKRGREPPAEPMEDVVAARVLPLGQLVDVDEIDVRAVVQLPSAELSHPDDREPPREAGDVPAKELPYRDLERTIHDDASEIRQLRRHRLHLVATEKVAR